MGDNWLQVASLVISVASFIGTIVIAVIGWLARGLFESLKQEICEARKQHLSLLSKLDLEREAIRREHREDVEALRAALEAIRREADDSVRRVHVRIDEVAQNYVPQAHCAVAMETSRELQDKLMATLQEGLREVRAAVMKTRGED
ncbi:MAG TPA: hypothetical protein VM492_13620 [Sumerlaeia bacterium]|nr:hypothetical protein [Sumerlaeia bacterium]